MPLDDNAVTADLPLERPLFRPQIAAVVLETGEGDVDAAALFAQVVVDREALVRHVRQALESRSQVSLEALVSERPLRQGLAELIACHIQHRESQIP